MSVLSQFSLLDPALFAKQFNAVYSGAVDNLALLDPSRMEAQMNTASSTTTFKPHGPLSRGITDPQWSPADLTNKLVLT